MSTDNEKNKEPVVSKPITPKPKPDLPYQKEWDELMKVKATVSRRGIFSKEEEEDKK